MNRQELSNQITNTLYSVMNSNQNDHLKQQKLLEDILGKLTQICDTLTSAMKEEPKAEPEEDQLSFTFDVTPEGPQIPAPRKAIRLRAARELLGGYAHKSLEFLISRGAEGFRTGGKCFIYEDSIQNIQHCFHKKKRVEAQPEDQFTDKKPEKAADRRYMSLNSLYRKVKDKYSFSELKNQCIDRGIFMGYKPSGQKAGNWYLLREEGEKLLKVLTA